MGPNIYRDTDTQRSGMQAIPKIHTAMPHTKLMQPERICGDGHNDRNDMENAKSFNTLAIPI